MNLSAILEFLRRRCGYRFPQLGRTAHDLFFRVGPKTIRAEIVPHIIANLDFRDEVQRATYWQGERFEQPTLRVLEDWIAEGATHFFDIGSNYGFFSLSLIAKFPQLLVHAFEPNPVTFAHVREIIDDNHLDRIRAWEIGLGDACAKLPFRRGVTDSGHSTFGNHPDLQATDVIEILDFETWRERADLRWPGPRKWIAKIDVEGFEMKVLSGLRPAFEKQAFRGVAVEINDFTLRFCGSKSEEIYSFMESFGFEALTKASDQRKRAFTGNEFYALR